MKLFAISIDLQEVPIFAVFPDGDVRNDMERGRRMSFRTTEVETIPEPGGLFQFLPPHDGRTFVCLAVHRHGIPTDHEAILVYQAHR